MCRSEVVVSASSDGSAGAASVAASAALKDTSARRKLGVLTFAMLFAMTPCAVPAPSIAFFSMPTVWPNEMSPITTPIGIPAVRR